jgi:LytS/YehU family sensor histidine kinase
MAAQSFTGKIRLASLHYLVWISILLISFFSMLQEDGAAKSALSALIGCTFYAIIIYGNSNFLYPRFYQRKKHFQYIVYAVALLIICGLGRGYLSTYVRNARFASSPRWLDTWSNLTFLLSMTTVFILSFIFRLAMAYFTLKQQSEEILLQRSQFELKLLKSQVQPHFLFNTLNNMYYEAYLEAPRTALMIERLSEIMRYFIDDSNKDYVSVQTEIDFIQNYIALEKIRIMPEPEIEMELQVDPNRKIPPMLLMTFVENIFKHGIDKISGRNQIHISIRETDDYLLFQTINLINQHTETRKGQSLGLKNLRQRLAILYGNNFTMETVEDGTHFTATLKIPLS